MPSTLGTDFTPLFYYFLFYPTLCYFILLSGICQPFIVYIKIELFNRKRNEAVYETIKNKVSITLDSDIIEQLKLLAEQDDRSFSQYINMILKEYLTQADKKKEA